MKNFTTIQSVPITQWGHTLPAIIHIPTTGAMKNGKFPLIIFFHGVGEAGTDLNKLVNQGLPYVVETQGDVYGTDPVSGDKINFIVVALQDGGWSPNPAAMPYVMPAIIKLLGTKYDPNFVYATGLSAGGTSAANLLTIADSVKYFGAVVPMSVAGWFGTSLQPAIDNAVKTWLFCGQSDGFIQYCKAINDGMNKLQANSSRLTVYPGGHDGWITYYDPAYKENGQSIYDFFLRCGKSVVIPPPVKTVKETIIIKVYTDGTFDTQITPS